MNLDLITNRSGRTRALRYKFKLTTEGCWEWAGGKNRLGYGKVVVDTVIGTVYLAHRLMYLLHQGAFDPALCVRHKCHNPLCCNPAHLELGTHADNMRDKAEAGRATKKLTGDDVLKIRSAYPALSQAELARLYGVGRATISMIVLRQTWAHI